MFFPFPHIIFNNLMACTLSEHTAVSTVYFFTFNSYKLQVCTLLFNPHYHFDFKDSLLTWIIPNYFSVGFFSRCSHVEFLCVEMSLIMAFLCLKNLLILVES